jgi:hypothetical protein
MSLRQGGDAADWFFAAQALWKSGKKDKARDAYDRAVAWAGAHAPADEEMRRFRDETAELLGVRAD